ncbi:GNAT family N-acetyltransferase [Kribbella antibiotica]|uniref:GNAT family N-acetyltransferase n=1 Tax=Kribbella antibiotica TaxID=190195 RepID=A0A4R4YW20_9ACTN|nr:GNAT family N-acetyltransferase [Kribbella antibiotica]TDD49080.1 GNAT family N-acetyltransferase [Kribbella antibiotica]
MTTLADILRSVEGGTFPIADLGVTVVSPPSARDSCVMAFTGHTVIAADVDPAWVAEQLPPEDPAEPVSPPFLTALGAAIGRHAHCLDAMLLAPALADPAVPDLVELADRGHPRLVRALEFRDDVRGYVDPYGGVVIVGRGVAGRLECAIEVPDAVQGQGHGRRLALAARALIPADAHIWAQVTPGNAASFRAFLAAGYRIVGSEISFL